jgi:hypothetical protein
MKLPDKSKIRLGHTDGNGYVAICPPPKKALFDEDMPDNIQTMQVIDEKKPHLEIGFPVTLSPEETIIKMGQKALIGMIDIGETNIVVDSQIVELKPGESLF